MKEYRVTESELTGIADAIREKADTDTPLEFPFGFVEAIEELTVYPNDKQYRVGVSTLFLDKVRISSEGYEYVN